MRVVELREGFGIEHLSLVERPEEPAPGPGQVLVRIRAVSLNYRDLVVVKGTYPVGLQPPFVPVSDGAGEVVAVGEGVSRVAVGDRVVGQYLQDWIAGELTEEWRRSSLGGPRQGLLRELALLPEHGLVHIPEHLSFVEAATLPIAALTAWSALFTHGHLQPGETVVLQGTGGVSLFGLQLAKLAGARTIVTSSSDEKRERAEALGADITLNYRTTPEWGAEVLRLTEGRGADHVLEVGGARTLEQSLRAIRYGGHVWLIGFLSGTTTELNLVAAMQRRARLNGIAVGSRTEFEAMNRAITQSGLRPVVDRVFPVEQVQDAFRYLELGAHFGKVAIAVG